MIYLIDSENVAGGWVAFALEKLGKDPAARFLVLYTDATPRLTYDEAAAVSLHLSSSILFSKCSKGRPNALDFRLVAQVGLLAMQEPEEEFCIVSNDQGFDEAIQAYQSGGIRVTRIPCSNRLTVDPPASVVRVRPLPMHQEKPQPEQDSVQTAPEEIQPDAEASTEEEPCPEEHAEAAAVSMDETARELQEVSEAYDRQRALHQKQRRYLSAYCSVPKMMAEAVRSALEKDPSHAEKTIRNSRARAFCDDPGAKENAIRCIREHIEEYRSISV